jgi:hypothetical protein
MTRQSPSLLRVSAETGDLRAIPRSQKRNRSFAGSAEKVLANRETWVGENRLTPVSISPELLTVSRPSAKARHMLSRKSYSGAECDPIAVSQERGERDRCGARAQPGHLRHIRYASGTEVRTVKIDRQSRRKNKARI